jgi:hypothetical protein
MAKTNGIKFAYLVRDEICELRDFVNEFIQYKKDDQDESNRIHFNALNIAIIITYGRIFKNNNGFTDTFKIIDEIKISYYADEKELHERLISLRDTEYAHSDSGPIDLQLSDESCVNSSRIQDADIEITAEFNPLMEEHKEGVVTGNESIKFSHSKKITRVNLSDNDLVILRNMVSKMLDVVSKHI